MNRERLARRRRRLMKDRGVVCEDRMYSGHYYGARCIFLAKRYQPLNDIYLCGIHARAYLRVEPIGVTAGPSQRPQS